MMRIKNEGENNDDDEEGEEEHHDGNTTMEFMMWPCLLHALAIPSYGVYCRHIWRSGYKQLQTRTSAPATSVVTHKQVF